MPTAICDNDDLMLMLFITETHVNVIMFLNYNVKSPSIARFCHFLRPNQAVIDHLSSRFKVEKMMKI